jgi:hypothetical protein
MSERPSQTWQREKTQQEAMVAAGTLRPGEAWALTVSPAFITGIDRILTDYEDQVRRLPRAAPDEQVWAAVERCVRAVNDAGEEIDTVTREELAEYLDTVLDKAGIDVDALTSRRGLDRAELTDQWRDW